MFYYKQLANQNFKKLLFQTIIIINKGYNQHWQKNTFITQMKIKLFCYQSYYKLVLILPSPSILEWSSETKVQIVQKLSCLINDLTHEMIVFRKKTNTGLFEKNDRCLA